MADQNKDDQNIPVVEDTSIDLDDLRRKFDTEARFRDLAGWQALLVTAVAVGLSLFHFYTAGFGLLLAIKQRAFHLGVVLFLVFLLYPMTEKSSKAKTPWYDYILAALAAYGCFYLIINFDALLMRTGLPTQMDVIMGFLTVGLLLEATRRVSSPVLPVIAVCFLVYCYYGRYFPALFQHRGFNILRIVNHMYLGTEERKESSAFRSRFRRRSCSCSSCSVPFWSRREWDGSSSISLWLWPGALWVARPRWPLSAPA